MSVDDTPAGMISRLDAALARRGQNIALRRVTLGPASQQVAFEVAVRANVRPVKPEELIGSIDQRQHRIVVSPTDLCATQFPMPLRKGDKAVVDGGVKDIEFVKPIKVADVLVRVELTVTG